MKTSKDLYHPDSFPIIRHRDDILPLLENNKGIRMFTHGPIQVVRYLINSPEVFTTPADLEARGLIFDTQTGMLLSRPLHKFFNLGERMDEEALISHGPGYMADKLDGSMIASFIQDSTLFFHTKGGVSSQAKAALNEAPVNVREAATEAFQEGGTPAFEWTSPDNRIVVDYDTSEMTLLAVRDRLSGVYDDDLANHLAKKYDLRQPKIHGRAETLEDLKNLISWLRQQEGMEGAVWIGPNGLRSKVKTTAYMKVHKTLSMLSVERHAFRAVVDEMDDDILPLLLPKQRDIWLEYAGAMRTRFLEISDQARAYYAKIEGLDPKAAAQDINANAPASLKTLVFGLKSGRDPVDLIKSVLSKNVGSDVKVQNAKKTYHLPDWDHQGAFMQDT